MVIAVNWSHFKLWVAVRNTLFRNMVVHFWSLLAIQLFYCIAIIAVAVTVAFDNHKIRRNWRVFVCILYYHIWGESEFQFQNFETHLLILFLLHKLDFVGGLLGQ